MAMPHPGSDLITTSLVQIYGENLNKKFELKGTQVVIGRNPNADIRLECPNVSSEHCILTFGKDGWSIKDNGSQMGTYINGEQLIADESKILLCGDRIFLGPPSTFIAQAFSVEVDYKFPENQTAIEFESPSIAESSTLTDDGADIIIDNEIKGITVVYSTFPPHKRKAPSVSEQAICESNVPTKITKMVKLSKSNLDDIASEFSEMIQNSSNWLHLQHDGLKPFPSAEDIDLPSCSYVDSSLSGQTDCDTLKSQLASMSKELLKCRREKRIILREKEVILKEKESILKEKEAILKDKENIVQFINKENNILVEQLIKDKEELKKCKQEKESILNDISNENNALIEQLVKEQDKLKEELQNFKFIVDESLKLKEELQNSQIRVKSEIRKELLDAIGEELLCSICSELLSKPSVLDCAHTFCEFCINTWMTRKKECPICRKKIVKVIRILTLDNFIEKAIETLTPEQKESRVKLIKEREEMEKKQKVSQMDPQQNHSNSRSRLDIIDLSRIRTPVYTLQPLPPTFEPIGFQADISFPRAGDEYYVQDLRIFPHDIVPPASRTQDYVLPNDSLESSNQSNYFRVQFE